MQKAVNNALKWFLSGKVVELVWKMSGSGVQICLCCLVTYVPNRCGNSGVVIAAEKLVPYGLHNPCSDWAAGTGEGTSPLSHDDLPREQRDRAVSQETSEASTTFLTSQRTTHVTVLLSLHLCVYSPVHCARLIELHSDSNVALNEDDMSFRFLRITSDQSHAKQGCSVPPLRPGEKLKTAHVC